MAGVICVERAVALAGVVAVVGEPVLRLTLRLSSRSAVTCWPRTDATGHATARRQRQRRCGTPIPCAAWRRPYVERAASYDDLHDWPRSESRYATGRRARRVERLGRRRHRRGLRQLESRLMSALTSETQPLLLVDELHGVRVFVEPAAADRPAVARHDSHRPVDRHHLRPGSSSDRCSCAGVRSAPMSLRSGATRGPRPLHAMAGGARALAVEERPARVRRRRP